MLLLLLLLFVIFLYFFVDLVTTAAAVVVVVVAGVDTTVVSNGDGVGMVVLTSGVVHWIGFSVVTIVGYESLVTQNC